MKHFNQRFSSSTSDVFERYFIYFNSLDISNASLTFSLTLKVLV